MTSWPTIPLGDLMVKRRGSVNPAQFEEEAFDLYSIPAYDLSCPEIAKGQNIGSAKQLVMPGDVLLSRIVPHIRRAWVVDGEQGNRKIASGEWIVFQSESVVPSYLRYFLLSDTFHLQFMRTVSGVGGSLLRARASETARITIPVPPLPEQERIVALLDEADALRKLRVQVEQRTTDLIPALFHDMFGDPAINPMGWPTEPLGNIVNFGSGGTPSRSNNRFWDGNIPWVSPKDMKHHQILDSQEHISEAALAETSLQLLPTDTVVIVVRGMILARRIPIALTKVPVSINQDMKSLMPKRPIVPQFLLWALESQSGRMLGDVSTAGHGTKRFDSSSLAAVQIPLAPTQRQTVFANRVTERDMLHESQTCARLKADTLFDSILSRAFVDKS